MVETKAKVDLKRADRFIQEAHGMWRAQVLSSAVELQIFDFLEEGGNKPKTLESVLQGCKMSCLRP